MRTSLFLLPVLALTAGFLLNGCGGASGGGSTGSTSTTASTTTQDGGATNAAMSQVVDGTSSAVLDDQTAGSTSSATAEAPLAKAFGGTVAAGSPLTVNLGTLMKPTGGRLLPNCTGVVTVTWAGAVVPSWPSATTASGVATVTVTFSPVSPVTYTDPASGVVVTVSSGSFTYDLTTSYTRTDAFNWSLTVNTNLAVLSTSALTGTVTKPNGTSLAASLYGYRKVDATWTRIKSGSPVTTTNLLTVSSLVSGTTTGVDSAAPTDGYTSWTSTLTTLGTAPTSATVAWNRRASVTVTYDYLRLTATVTASEKIFLALNGGSLLGPYTSAQLLSLYGTTSTGTGF